MSHRYDQAKQPRFPVSVSPQTFEIAAGYIRGLSYTGPVALSCDDTKLHPVYCTYFCTKHQSHILVGSTEDIWAVANPDELRALLKTLPKGLKATKVCFIPCRHQVLI